MYGTDSGTTGDEPLDRQPEPDEAPEREGGASTDGSRSGSTTPGDEPLGWQPSPGREEETTTDRSAADEAADSGFESGGHPDEAPDPGGATDEKPDTGRRRAEPEPLNPLERLKRSYKRHPKRTAIRVLVGQALLLIGGAILAGNDPHTIVRGLGVLILTNPELVGVIIALLGTALLGSDYKDEVRAISRTVVALLQSERQQRDLDDTDGQANTEPNTVADTDADTRSRD